MSTVSKNKILVLGPILPRWSEMSAILRGLSFLESSYEIDLKDPLGVNFHEMSNDSFFEYWRSWFKDSVNKYDIYIGFSLGGALIQSSIDLISRSRKKVILFSTPSMITMNLSNKINEILFELNNNDVERALTILNKYVFLPGNKHVDCLGEDERDLINKRLKFGLNFILNVDNRSRVSKTEVNCLHLIGSDSQLITIDNIKQNALVSLNIVAQSGMRVLQDNPAKCEQLIMRYLEE